jgi:hypothetical protein
LRRSGHRPAPLARCLRPFRVCAVAYIPAPVRRKSTSGVSISADSYLNLP